MPQFRSSDAATLYRALTSEAKLVPQTSTTELGLLVLHISEGCNLGCTYCFADRGHYGHKSTKWMQPTDAVNAVKGMLVKYRALRGIKFFGGEPFLNIDAMEAVCRFIHDHKFTECPRPDLHAVTNLTILNDRSLDVVARYGLNLTASIDGPPELHNRFRVFMNGKGSFDRVDQNIRRYRELTGQPQVLEVVYSPAHMAAGHSMAEVHRFLVDRYGIKDIIMHPMEPHDPATHLITQRQWSEYRVKMYDESRAYGEYYFAASVAMNQVDKLAVHFKKMTAAEHKNSHCDLGVDTLTVTANGSVYPCYTLIGKEQFVMADHVSALDGVRFDQVQKIFLENKKSDNPECRACSIFTTCHQCPGEMYSQAGQLNVALPIACDFMTGFTEGLLNGLDKTRSAPDFWPRFVSALNECAVH